MSDVIGDDLESIGSGPCTGDSWTSEATVALLASHGLLDKVPGAARELIHRETPKLSTIPFLRELVPRIVANNDTAVAAAAPRQRAAQESQCKSCRTPCKAKRQKWDARWRTP